MPAPLKSGSAALDKALGVGGYPRGVLVEMVGNCPQTKIALALSAVREAQSGGHVAAFFDLYRRLDVSHAVGLGVDTGRLLVSQPNTTEQALEIVELLTRSGACDLVVVDFGVVAATDPAAPASARFVSETLRKLTAVAHRTGTTLLFLTPPVGQAESDPRFGTNALKFYASVRLDVRQLGSGRTLVKVVKNRLAPPFREAELLIGRAGVVDAAAFDMP